MTLGLRFHVQLSIRCCGIIAVCMLLPQCALCGAEHTTRPLPMYRTVGTFLSINVVLYTAPPLRHSATSPATRNAAVRLDTRKSLSYLHPLFITVFTTALSSQMDWHTASRYTLILSSHPCLCLPNCVYPSCFSTAIVFQFIIAPRRSTCPAYPAAPPHVGTVTTHSA
jgi:hypothetical protein